jgi:hypothetical protein
MFRQRENLMLFFSNDRADNAAVYTQRRSVGCGGKRTDASGVSDLTHEFFHAVRACWAPGQNPLHGVGCAQIAGAGFEIGLRMSLANRFDCLIDVFLRPTVDDVAPSPGKPEPMAKPIPAVEPVTSAILLFNCKSTIKLPSSAFRTHTFEIQDLNALCFRSYS